MNNLPPNSKVKAQLCRVSYYHFFKEFWPVVSTEKLVDNWHIKFIANELQTAAERVFKREKREYDLVINVPPGSSKSTICTILFPVWLWVRDASIRIISSSYSSSLSVPHSVKSRDVLMSDKFKAYFGNLIELKDDANNKTEYENTKGGVRISTSTGGTITGKHAHVILIDDPLNPEQSESATELETANRYINTTLSSRKIDNDITLTILIMQRLHESDPTANTLEKKQGKVKHICLPAELSDNVSPFEARQHYQNGYLDPVRLSAEVLEEKKRELGSYGYAGQYDQQPSPKNGTIWDKWFVPVPDSQFPMHLQEMGTDWDTAFTKDEMNAASAYVTAGKYQNRMYIDNIGWVYQEFPQLVNTMKMHPSPHYIEQKASGKSAKQTLVQNGVAAIEVDVPGGSDKIARARSATPYAEAGMVYVRASLLDKLYNDSEQGILRFPKSPKKDLADALAQSIIRILGKPQTRTRTQFHSRQAE